MMKIAMIIFRYEWLQLTRNSFLKWLFLLMTVCACYAIYYGNSSIKRQLGIISAVQQPHDSIKNVFFTYFKDKKVADSVRFGWAKMNSLYDGFTTEHFLENNAAINLPNRFSALSIGQRDIYPLYRKVTARSLYYDGTGIALEDKYVELNNPHKLLAGNFDLSFVFIYLFPLFVIAIGFNVVAYEKEIGTYAFIRNIPISFQKIVAVKFLFRFLLVLGLATTYFALGYALSPVKDSFSLPQFLVWWCLTAAYLVFWFSIATLIVSLNHNSSVSALGLIGCWILFLLVIPSLVNYHINIHYKVNSRIALLTELREQADKIWDMPDSITLAAYYKDYPQYRQTPLKPLWTSQDSYDNLGKNEDIDDRYNKKLLVWHYYLDKQIQQNLATYQQQLLKKQSASERFAYINPVVTTQEAYNDLAVSGYRHYQRFREATADYRNAIFSKTNQFIFERKKLTEQDYRSYPAFEMPVNTASTKEPLKTAMLLLILSGLVLMGSQFLWRINF